MPIHSLLYLVLGGCIALLVLPSVVEFRLLRHLAPPALVLQVDWAFWVGLAGLRLHLGAASPRLYLLILGHPLALPRRRPARRPRPRAPSLPPPSTSRTLKGLRALAPVLLKPGLEFLKDLRKTTTFRQLHLSGYFGFDDPATTGRLSGVIYGLTHYNIRKLHLDLHADFTRPGLEGQLRASLYLHLGRLLFILLRCTLRIGARWLALHLPWLPWKPRLI